MRRSQVAPPKGDQRLTQCFLAAVNDPHITPHFRHFVGFFFRPRFALAPLMRAAAEMMAELSIIR